MDDVAFFFTFFLLIQLCKLSSVFDNALIYFISAQTVLFIHHWMLFLKTSIISEPLWSGEAVNQKFGEQSREAWLSYLTSKWLTKLTPRLIPLPSRSVIVFKGTALKNYPPPLFFYCRFAQNVVISFTNYEKNNNLFGQICNTSGSFFKRQFL